MFQNNTKKMTDLSRQERDAQQQMRNNKAQEDARKAAFEKKMRQIAQCQDQMARMDQYAETAMIRGDETMARFYLEKKLQWKDQMHTLMEDAGITPQESAQTLPKETAQDMTEQTPKE